MPFISVEHAQAGMVLSNDVTDRRGRLLIPSGRSLDKKHIQALRMWGITGVEVEGEDPGMSADPSLGPADLGRAREVLADRLQNLPMDHPLVMTLVEVVLPRLARELADEAGESGVLERSHVQ